MWKDTPMPSYLNMHSTLEGLRNDAAQQGGHGPKVRVATAHVDSQVMIIGPPSSGKSTLARILSSYAARVNRVPLLVDLDVSEVSQSFVVSALSSIPPRHSHQGSTFLPGMATIVPIDKAVDPLSLYSDFGTLVGCPRLC